MELELRHLRVVSTIAETGSVTKAAAELGVAQSALTAQLARIERALGGPLFVRDHRGARPTPLGELVVGRAQLVLPAMSGLIDDASRLHDAERGGAMPEHLTVGASTSAILAPFIQRLSEWSERMRVSTTASWSADELAGDLGEGKLDFAVVGVCSGSGAPGTPDLAWRTFSVDPVFVMLRPDHPLADRQEVSLADLRDADWAATPGDGCFRDCFTAACAREGFTPTTLYVADAASCVDLVESGTAVALCQATRVLPGLVTVPLVGAPLRWNHLIGWRTESPAAALAEAAVATVAAAHADLVARSEVYSAWIQRHGPLGPSGESITAAV